MAEPISGQIGKEVAEQLAQEQTKQNPQREVSPQEEAAMQEALNRPADASAPVEQTSQAEQVDGKRVEECAEGDQSERCKTMGEAILETVQNVKESMDARADRVESKLINNDGEPMSVEDCIKVNFEVMQMTLEQDLTGKIATKTSDGVQTLFKNN